MAPNNYMFVRTFVLTLLISYREPCVHDLIYAEYSRKVIIVLQYIKVDTVLYVLGSQ